MKDPIEGLQRRGLKDGWWWNRKYTPGDTVLEKLETEAQEARKGLWADPYSVPPVGVAKTAQVVFLGGPNLIAPDTVTFPPKTRPLAWKCACVEMGPTGGGHDKRHTEEQIIAMLEEIPKRASGVQELCRKHGISDATFYKW